MRHSGIEPRACEAEKIAKALAVSVEYLASGENLTQIEDHRKKYLQLKTKLKDLANSE